VRSVYWLEFHKEAVMADLIYVSVLIAFFGLAALFVVACDRIIGPDDAALREGLSAEPTPEPEVTHRKVAA
jgi:hypothetical protein